MAQVNPDCRPTDRFSRQQYAPLAAGVGQRGRELAIEVGVVFDDEQAQGIILR